MLRTLYALTYVASQLSTRWLPMPETVVFAWPDDDGVPIESWDVARVQRFIQFLVSEEPYVLPWLHAYLAFRDADARQLGKATCTLFSECEKRGAQWLCPLDPEFPPLLRAMRDPPLGLIVLGDLTLLERPMVAVVGSRKASARAVHASFDVGRRLAEAGVTVVSGGALGCDIAAHQGVLAAALPERDAVPACCVFAGGLDRLYPYANSWIFERLRRRRAVFVSERLWGAHSSPADFHARNRLIPGMSGTTLLMQAAERSGAMLTARLSLDQGRDLAVLLHPAGDVRASGSEALIRDGAPSFASAEEVVEALRLSACQAVDKGDTLAP